MIPEVGGVGFVVISSRSIVLARVTLDASVATEAEIVSKTTRLRAWLDEKDPPLRLLPAQASEGTVSPVLRELMVVLAGPSWQWPSV